MKKRLVSIAKIDTFIIIAMLLLIGWVILSAISIEITAETNEKQLTLLAIQSSIAFGLISFLMSVLLEIRRRRELFEMNKGTPYIDIRLIGSNKCIFLENIGNSPIKILSIIWTQNEILTGDIDEIYADGDQPLFSKSVDSTIGPRRFRTMYFGANSSLFSSENKKIIRKVAIKYQTLGKTRTEHLSFKLYFDDCSQGYSQCGKSGVEGELRNIGENILYGIQELTDRISH